MSSLTLRRQSRGLGLSPRRRAANGAAPSIVQDGLVAEWRFDEGAGQVLTDYTGNGHHGRLGSTTGADAADPTWTAQGLSFDGGDFVECDSVGISGGAARTFIGVVRPGSGGGWAVKWNADGGGERWCIKNVAIAGNVLRTEYNSGGNTTTLVVTPQQWAFVAVTKSGANANTEIAHVNGSSEAITRDQVLNTMGNFRWGESGSLSSPTGEICEFAYGLVYDRALTPAEIAQSRAALTALLAGRGIVLP